MESTKALALIPQAGYRCREKASDCAMNIPDWLSTGWPHIWLPYTQMQDATLPLPVIGADGCRLHLADGRSLVDGTSSWWSVCHGYQHPHLVEAIQKQAGQLSHVMFGGLAHEPAYTLANRLAALTGLPRVFFSDSGSTAVEVALKMALQYWRNKGNHKKTKFISFEHGYHGDTMGAMSVSSREGMHQAFDSLTHKHYSLPIPNDEYSFAEFEELVAAIAPTAAALIIEPLVQGAGGLLFHSADVLAEIRRVCREHEILFIADEIMTGFYRTGSRFACDEAGITPDILCLGKALTGGHIGLAATLASDTIFEAFLSDSPDTAFMHGPTYMANPIACAAANASLDLFEREDYADKTEAIEQQLHRELAACSDLARDIRVKGAIGVVEIDASPEDIRTLRTLFVNHDVWLRPFGSVVYIMPPLTITPDELSILTRAARDGLTEWSNAAAKK